MGCHQLVQQIGEGIKAVVVVVGDGMRGPVIGGAPIGWIAGRGALRVSVRGCGVQRVAQGPSPT